MSSYQHTLKLSLIASLVSLAMSSALYADDTEIFLGENGNVAENPNVLFIIDTSGSMAENTDGKKPKAGEKSKLEIVQGVFTDLINKASGINAAIMRYDDRTSNNGADNKGGYFLSPMKPLNSTNRGSFVTTVSGLSTGGYTPSSETLYEASLYWRGKAIEFGNSTSPGVNPSSVKQSDDPLTTLDESTLLYQSPIVSQCQKNYTVLLTDGLPTFDADADTQINTLIKTGTNTSTTGIAIDKSCDFSGYKNGNDNPSDFDNCLDELSQYMYENDMVPDVVGKDYTKGKQNVTTYTIGFATTESADLLSNTAKAGGGKFYPAATGANLADALSSILDEIGKQSISFTSPTIALNAYNGINHHDELYFAQFKPENSPKWPGNLKSYVLSYDPNATCVSTLKDADGNDALEPAAKCEDRYQIIETARSFWSNKADGSDVTQGGAAGKLGTSRNVYTYVGASDPSYTSQVVLKSNKLLETETALLDHDLFGFTPTEAAADSSFTELKNLIAWSRGIDVDDNDGDGSTTDSRNSMGDPLHSQPVIVTYGTTDENNSSMVLYVATNEGFLHAIDVSISAGSNASSGDEKFAYIPKELLPNLKTFKTNTSTSKHPYGLDGAISAWVNDINGNGTIDTSDGDFVYLYVGMRRGGKNYYALNVTDPDNPKLMWVIKGGAGDFTELAQTWSKPVLGNIMISGTKTKVLVFAGGYDKDQDTAAIATADDTGRAIYVVNAETGQRVWWAGPSGSGANLEIASMNYSIPSDIRVLDTDLDGLHDRMYVGDMHAQLFRIDIDDEGNFAGDRVAAFGGTDAAGNRRFYSAPDVVLTRTAGRAPYLTINIGSGYRAHPLNTTIQDRFYSIRDYAIFTKPESYITLLESNLLDVTTSLVSSAEDYNTLFTTNTGWMLRFPTMGEKVLSSSLTFNSSIFFTTYIQANNTVICAKGGSGSGKLYVVNLFDGNPLVNSPVSSAADVSDLTTADRSGSLKAPGIPPAPTVAFSPKKPVACVGMQCFPDALDIVVDKTYWEQAQ